MLRSVIESSLRMRFVILALAAALIVFGVTQLPNLSVDVLPEFAPPYVEIQTESLGLSAEEVEQLITVPMEHDLLNGVPWLDTIRSESVPGLSSIVLVFQPGTDLNRARQMVAERLTQAHALPHVSKPPTMLQPLSATSRVMIIGLSSKNLSLIQMSVLARWVITPRLMGIPGVANVAIWGQRDRQLQVQVDPKQLQAKNVSLLQVLETTGNALWVSTLSFVEASTPGTGGFIDTSNQRLGIRHILPIVSPEGLAQVPVEGTSLHLGEVANVVEDHQPLIGDALTNDGPSLLLVVEKFPGANTLEVTRDVNAAMDDMRPGLSGMETDSSIFRPADFIELAMNNLTTALLLGFALMALAVIAFFFDWRKVLVSLTAIPVSLMAAAVVFYLTGATLNMIAVTGFVIAIGVVVGDAIIDTENITRRLRQARSEGSTKSTAGIILDASLEVRSLTLYALVILVLAVVPVFALHGQASDFFQPLAISYILALVASMLVASTFTPALCLILFANAPVEQGEAPLVRRLRKVYENFMARFMPHGRAAFAVVVALTLIGVILMPFLSQSLLPSFKERNLLVHLNGAPGTSQPEMTRISGLVSNELRSVPGVRTVAAHVGRAVLGDQVVNVSSAELWVTLDPTAPYDATLNSVKSIVNDYPGLTDEVQTYLSETSSGVLTKQSDSIVVRLYGEQADALRAKAEDIKQTLTGMNGIVDTHINLPVQEPTFEIKVDLAKAQQYGIKPGDVRRAAATLLSGILVGNLFEDQKVFDVVVWGTPETRNSMSSIQDLVIDTPEGGHVRLGDVAQVQIVSTASVVRHDSTKRYLDIVSTVRGRDLAAVAGEINSRLDQVQFPMEYHAEILGDYTVQQNAQRQLLIASIVAALGIFFLLQAAYSGWRLAFLSAFTFPSALTGGLVATALTGGVLSLGSVAGFLAVFAIAMRSQMLLINHYQRLAKESGKSLDTALGLSGASEGLTPTLMTTLAAGLVMLPVLFLGDIPGLEIVRPMAIVILGGLTTSAVLNLFLIPALVLRVRLSPAPELELAPHTEVAPSGMLGGARATGE